MKADILLEEVHGVFATRNNERHIMDGQNRVGRCLPDLGLVNYLLLELLLEGGR